MREIRTKGKHPSKALSPVKIRALTEPGRYADGNGLYLVVDDRGSKRWVLRIVIHGRRADIGLGGLATVPLADDRIQAQRMRQAARAGEDPLAQRKAQRVQIPTFREAAETVHRARLASWKNEKHADQWLNTLVSHIFSKLGARRIDQIQSHDVLSAISDLWQNKPETARRVLQRIRVVFDWAKASGFRSTDNPVEGLIEVLPRHMGGKLHMAAMPYLEVPAFVATATRSGSAPTASDLALEFLILTACRTNEVLGSRWSEIDAGSATWTIPATRMKAAKEHRVPLSKRAVEILAEAKNLDGDSEFVFRGYREGKPLSNMALLMKMRRMKQPFTVHGFRSAFRDWASERTNFAREVCEMALAHTIKSKAEAAYRRGDLLDKRRDLMETWSRFVTGHNGDVVQLRAGQK